MIVDDFSAVRAGITSILLEGQDPWCVDIDICAQAGTVAETLSIVAEKKPDILLLDIGLPDGSGLDAIEPVLESSPDTKIIVVTASMDKLHMARAMKRGARGYLTQDDLTTDRLVGAILAVSSGAAVIIPLHVSSGEFEEDMGPISLDDTEWTVLKHLSRGEKESDIARYLDVSELDIKRAVKGLCQKLGFDTRIQAVVYARDFLLGSGT